ncbi:hypothetical protein JW823_06910 [bacterium]|nr:hypothetical protein [candidate division CSSED10-310 bacterium]
MRNELVDTQQLWSQIDSVPSVQKDAGYLRFPLLQSLIETGRIKEIMQEMMELCDNLKENSVWDDDFDLSLRSETARMGLMEVIEQLQNLRDLAEAAQSRVNTVRGDK